MNMLRREDQGTPHLTTMSGTKTPKHEAFNVDDIVRSDLDKIVADEQKVPKEYPTTKNNKVWIFFGAIFVLVRPSAHACDPTTFP